MPGCHAVAHICNPPPLYSSSLQYGNDNHTQLFNRRQCPDDFDLAFVIVAKSQACMFLKQLFTFMYTPTHRHVYMGGHVFDCSLGSLPYYSTM